MVHVMHQVIEVIGVEHVHVVILAHAQVFFFENAIMLTFESITNRTFFLAIYFVVRIPNFFSMTKN